MPPSSTPSGDIPEPPQCDQLVDCSWSEQGGGGHPDQYDSSGQVESALEATEFTVRAMESESRQVSIKRNKSNLEGGVAIEMSAQPLLELTPMPGSEYRTRLLRCRIVLAWLCVGSNNTSTAAERSPELMPPLPCHVVAQLKMFSPLYLHYFCSEQQRDGCKPSR